jgi:hypothetical protein
MDHGKHGVSQAQLLVQPDGSEYPLAWRDLALTGLSEQVVVQPLRSRGESFIAAELSTLLVPMRLLMALSCPHLRRDHPIAPAFPIRDVRGGS